MSNTNEPYALISIELTSDEQISLLGLLLNSTNRIIASGDPNNWLPDLERIEEKIRDQQDDISERVRGAIISNFH